MEWGALKAGRGDVERTAKDRPALSPWGPKGGM